MNWNRIKPKNKWVLFALTLVIGLANYSIIMWSLYWYDPAQTSWWIKGLHLILMGAFLVYTYAFLDWFNGFRMVKGEDGVYRRMKVEE